jgi:uncharacterized protein (DUF2252 family)
MPAGGGSSSLGPKGVATQTTAETAADSAIFAAGKALRKNVARTAHAKWEPPSGRPDPLDLLEKSNDGRLPHLIPVRFGRMSESPFAFLRGSATIMASDLGSYTPNTGVYAQCCGDSHIANFGTFATPERNVIFDINDFDETLPAPWEWDVKRLAASIHIAGRGMQFSEKLCAKAVLTAVREYRQEMRACADMTALQVWYQRIDATAVSQQIQTSALRVGTAMKDGKPVVGRPRVVVPEDYSEGFGEAARIKDKPPSLFHVNSDDPVITGARTALEHYHHSLPDHVAALIERYALVDLAVKVVGVGSVGTRCTVGLFAAKRDDLLLLQVKEARASVLEPYAGKSRYDDPGRRVAVGQRLMQSAADMFLGWTQADGHTYYVRQLSDAKGRANLLALTAPELTTYAGFCGKVLAASHARTTEAALVGGYLGATDTFDVAVASFARAYADQNDKDYEAFVKAIRSGRIVTEKAPTSADA